MTKPQAVASTATLTRYDHMVEWQRDLADCLQGYASRMVPDEEGQWYAKDEADAVIRELTRQRDNAQQFLDECSVSIAELIEQVEELEAERDAARAECAEHRMHADQLQRGNAELSGLLAAQIRQIGTQGLEIQMLRADVEALRADAERWRWALENCVAFQAVFKDEAGMIQAMDWECGGDEKLDAAIDAARAAGREG